MIQIFDEIQVEFLIVGHTGNAVDQLFSVLSKQFEKVNIRTLEELFTLIENSSIQPKPVVLSLQYIWDWKSCAKTK